MLTDAQREHAVLNRTNSAQGSLMDCRRPESEFVIKEVAIHVRVPALKLTHKDGEDCAYDFDIQVRHRC